MLDAFKYDGMNEEREYRQDLSEHWHGVWAELQLKMEDYARLVREVAEAEARARQTPPPAGEETQGPCP
jgi:hypothetical protein